jgi:hypothetical protein
MRLWHGALRDAFITPDWGAIQLDVDTGPQPPSWKFGVRRLAAAVVAGRIPETTAGASFRTPNNTCPLDTLPHQFESHPPDCVSLSVAGSHVLESCMAKCERDTLRLPYSGERT